MTLEILHKTEYTYSENVFFEPHILRFKPKINPHSEIKEFSIKISPDATGISEQFDVENNHLISCWFEETYSKLEIISRSVVKIIEFNPFNFILYPDEYLKIPFDYNNKTKQLLRPALISKDIPDFMFNYLKEILVKTKYNTIDFLVRLTEDLFKNFEVESRETGQPHSPEITFKKGIGSCRDLSWMLIHLLRKAGIGSRFVSGYYYINIENPAYELHAWVEAYLPGAGWIGLDPSHGILADCFHVPVSSSAFYENTMPVTGTIKGSARSKLNHKLYILFSKQG